MDDPFLTTQILTYMGNKRKLLKSIEDVIIIVKKELNTDKLNIGEGFSGSGVVSRLLKKHSSSLYVNDIAGYSETLNKCFLSSPDKNTLENICFYIKEGNNLLEDTNNNNLLIPWISKHWAPQNNNISIGERTYYTCDNAKRIDILRNYINTIPNDYKHFLLASLLVESSIHNNTNGQFAGYYKDENNIGAFGGKNKVDLQRITKPIELKVPLFHLNNCNVSISRKDTNEWVTQIPELDLVYYDPPYNKHPYNIYYFLLDIINDWNLSIDIPDTYRGQPKNWIASEYNSSKNAKKAMDSLISNTKSKYILLSYNDGGIIPINELDSILEKYGTVYKIPVEHKTYNRLKGLSNYKRKNEYKGVKEFLWFIHKNN
jgi:adenine-specific DNA-methyltransferase